MRSIVDSRLRVWRRPAAPGEPLSVRRRRRILRRDLRVGPAGRVARVAASRAAARVRRPRGRRTPDDLALRLDQLLPVSSLDGVEQAAELLLACHRTRARVLIVGDFDADGATSTALRDAPAARARLRAARFPGAGPLPLRLRADARDRARRGGAQARPDRDRRQRHLVDRRRRRGAAARASTCW